MIPENAIKLFILIIAYIVIDALIKKGYIKETVNIRVTMRTEYVIAFAALLACLCWVVMAFINR